MIADWMMPTLEQVRARREERGCGMATAKQQLIYEKLTQEMPKIIEEQDVARLAQATHWLLLRCRPSYY